MRIAAGLLLASVFCAGGIRCVWGGELPHALTSYRGDCSLRMPRMPERVTESIYRPEQGLELEYEAYLAEGERGQIYMLLIATYAHGIDALHPEGNLEGFLNGMIGYHGQTVLDHAVYDALAGRQAIHFRLLNGSKAFHGHVLVDGDRLYLLALEAPAAQELATTYEAFAASFRLLAAEETI